MISASKNRDPRDSDLISKILRITKELISTLPNLFKAKGPVALVLIFSSLCYLFLFILLLVILIFYRQNLTPLLFVFLVFGLCGFFLFSYILTLIILKKYLEHLAKHPVSGLESLGIDHNNGIVVERKPLHEIMKSAKRCILISGHTLRKFTKEARRDDVKDALNFLWGKRVDVTLIFLHPESPYAEAHQPFHPEESVEIQTEKEKYKNQIQEAIKYCIDKGRDQTNCCVYLSYYKPPFRTIVIDDPEFCFSSETSTNGIESKCYIDLYMYGVDVEKTPRIMFPEKSHGYAEIVNSINKLRSSCHMFPLVVKGEIYEDWKDRGLFHILQACAERNCHESCKRCDLLSNALFGNQNPDDHHPEIYSKDYEAGTFTLNHFEDYKHFLVKDERCDFDKWLEDAVRIEFDGLKKQSKDMSQYLIERYKENIFEKYKVADIVEKVRATFKIGPGTFNLSEHIWCQEYSDVIRRIILTHVLGDPDFEIDICPKLTSESEKLALQVIDHLCYTHASGTIREKLQKWLDFSIIAGLLGLDSKPDRTATSLINHEIGIKLKLKQQDETGKKVEESDKEAVNRIAKELSLIQADKSSLESGEDIIDDSSEFFEFLNQKRNLTLISFPDDYIETFFLLKYYDFLLGVYDNLKIHIIPRSIRCGNDVTASDIDKILKNSENGFANLVNPQRFEVIKKGPKIGGVNLRRIHENVAKEIRNADLLDVRGARNYEMMQRVNKKAFFGFMVARRISEAVTGLPQSKNSFFYHYQKPNTCSFKPGWEDKHF